MNEECPICWSSLNSPIRASGDKHPIDCPRCGEFVVSGVVSSELYHKPLNGLQIANASGWIRQYRQRGKILLNDVETLRNQRTPTVAEKANKLLLYLSKEFPIPGQSLNFNWNESPLLAVTWSQNVEELSYLFKDYLYGEKVFLIYELDEQGIQKFKISPVGWAYIDSLKQINPESRIAFVAMWFDEKVKPLWSEAIKPSIEAAGYEPLRIDMHQHNNRIDDEIIAMIRRSRFLVAEFTDQRGGVYFKAGFARSLGLEVIWICPRNELKNVHFDTRQYNFITWEDGNLEDLRKALQYRIEATIGRGNYKPQTA